MRRLWVAPLSAVLCTATAARADDPFFELLQQPADDRATPQPVTGATPPKRECMPPGYFNGIGSCHRMWEAQVDASFDTNRVVTHRIELARAFALFEPVSIVLRVNSGFAMDTNSGIYMIKGPIVSAGIRDESRQGNFWVELGVRFVPGLDGPNEGEPSAQRLALGATFSSGLADDARWLPFSDSGLMFYGAIQNRTNPGKIGGSMFYGGAFYGGNASLWPMKVRSWLGPQVGFISNAFTDLYLGIVRLFGRDVNLQVGLHGEASLSTIWPAERPFPVLGGGFLAWSPEYWFAMRLFAGGAGSPAHTPVDTQYGFRVELFVP